MDSTTWTLADAVIRHISVSDMDNNVYLITCRRTGEQLLIDAADDYPAIAALLTAGAQDVDDDVTATGARASLALVVTTHSHWDHVRALAAVVAATGAPTAAGRKDAPAIEVPTDTLLDDGSVLDLDGVRLDVIGLRGHTPGSVALLLRDPDGPDHLFTGDSLFPGGVGNTQHDAKRFSQLYADVVARVFDPLDDDTIVHPGHGAGTTLGAERPSLGEWRERGW
ncbi:MBL fold metallo-hydrolase [Specibacter cremeus]|uniref:MBL fold metallo-hydrolase n=1 Tax=Specibacter cremeus TaxID=1629051 RepID=UPI000F77379F|nr:MBL fold metallo-hydrolase [Specibacter cremeus]